MKALPDEEGIETYLLCRQFAIVPGMKVSVIT